MNILAAYTGRNYSIGTRLASRALGTGIGNRKPLVGNQRLVLVLALVESVVDKVWGRSGGLVLFSFFLFSFCCAVLLCVRIAEVIWCGDCIVGTVENTCWLVYTRESFSFVYYIITTVSHLFFFFISNCHFGFCGQRL